MGPRATFSNRVRGLSFFLIEGGNGAMGIQS